MSNRTSPGTHEPGPRAHALGEGPGSIFVHAVSERRRGALEAVCGHELSPELPRLGARAASVTTFEALADIPGGPGCPRCADLLSLALRAPDETDAIATAAAPTAREGSIPRPRWTRLGAIAVSVMVAAGVLGRLLFALLDR